MENKFTNILNKSKNLPIPGKVQAAIKIVIFTDIAVLFGLWIGIKMFFPDDFVISKINEMLFAKDLAVVADDVSVSMLGTVSFEEGSLLQKGSKAVSFKKLSFSPALFKTIGGHPAGVLSVEDINSQGGELELSFNTEENPCYSFVSDEIPLSASKPFTSDVVVTGSLSGNGDVCSTGGKYNGKLELNAVDMILRGKVPTPMGDFDVGKIVLGDVELLADVADSKVEIKKFTVNGIFELETSGKIILNNRVLASSRLDLEIKAKVPDMTKITENVALNLLVSQLSEYKTEEENSFAFSLKGFLNKPQMGKFSSKDRDLKDGRPPKKSEKPANSRPQRLQRSEKLPQRLKVCRGYTVPITIRTTVR